MTFSCKGERLMMVRCKNIRAMTFPGKNWSSQGVVQSWQKVVHKQNQHMNHYFYSAKIHLFVEKYRGRVSSWKFNLWKWLIKVKVNPPTQVFPTYLIDELWWRISSPTTPETLKLSLIWSMMLSKLVGWLVNKNGNIRRRIGDGKPTLGCSKMSFCWKFQQQS